jgi:chromosome partitioning protein
MLSSLCISAKDKVSEDAIRFSRNAESLKCGKDESMVCYHGGMVAIAIINQKGGSGKTTTASTLAVTLSRAGQRVHLIDMDPQASLSRRVFRQPDKQGLLYEALTNRTELPVVQLSETLSLTPSSIHLAKGESQFLSLPAREYLLEKSLRQTLLADDTLVFIDCPPSLGVLTFNCLTAADKVVIPIVPDELVVDVLPNLHQTIETTRKHLNPRLEVLGVVLNQVDDRQKIVPKVEQSVRKVYRLLGKVHVETSLQYAVGGGTLPELTNSRALDEYYAIAKKINAAVWETETSLAA